MRAGGEAILFGRHARMLKLICVSLYLFLRQYSCGKRDHTRSTHPTRQHYHNPLSRYLNLRIPAEVMIGARTPPLFRLPFEIRLQIFSYLFSRPELASSVDGIDDLSHVDENAYFHACEKSPLHQSSRMLCLRNSNLVPMTRSRKRYKVRDGRLRLACEDASYICTSPHELHTSILSTNRQIHDEAAEILYGLFVFDFSTDIEACTAFFNDLTPLSRGYVKHIRIVKRALPYETDFDRCEWRNMCDYLSHRLHLDELSLGIIAGKPIGGWYVG